MVSTASSPVRAGRWVLGLTLLSVISLFLPRWNFFANAQSYLPIHIALELVSISVSIMVFGLIWALRSQMPNTNSHAVLMGVGFLGVAVLDLAHTLSYAGMPDFVTPSGAEKAIDFWLFGRYLAAATLCAVAFSKPTPWSQVRLQRAIVLVLAFACAVIWSELVLGSLLPRTFLPSSGLTAFKIVAEYGLVGLFGVAGIGIWQRSHKEELAPDWQWLAAAAVVQALAELHFTRYTNVTDAANLLGHIYKAMAYLMIYRAVFATEVRAPYQKLNRDHAKVTRSSALFHGVFDQSNLLGAILDANGRVMEINDMAMCYISADRAAVLGRYFPDTPWWDSAEDRHRLIAAMARAHEIGHSSLDASHPLPNGRRAHVLVNLTRIHLENGNHLSVTGMDITQLKESEAALQSSQQVLAMAQSVAHIGHYQIDPATGMWSSNTLLDAIMGIDSNFVRDGAHWLQLIHPLDREGWLQFSEGCRQSDRSHNMEYRIIRPRDGVERWVGAWVQNFFDADNKLLYRIGAVQDITERKAAETAMRQQLVELERFNHAAVGRELEMIELKRQINELHARLGEKPPFALRFLTQFDAVAVSTRTTDYSSQ